MITEILIQPSVILFFALREEKMMQETLSGITLSVVQFPLFLCYTWSRCHNNTHWYQSIPSSPHIDFLYNVHFEVQGVSPPSDSSRWQQLTPNNRDAMTPDLHQSPAAQPASPTLIRGVVDAKSTSAEHFKLTYTFVENSHYTSKWY